MNAVAPPHQLSLQRDGHVDSVRRGCARQKLRVCSLDCVAGGVMTKTLACALSACLLFAVGAPLRTTAAQDRTAQPGQPTQGKVWIQNRGDVEAVPVTIQNMATEGPPLRVQVV